MLRPLSLLAWVQIPPMSFSLSSSIVIYMLPSPHHVPHPRCDHRGRWWRWWGDGGDNRRDRKWRVIICKYGYWLTSSRRWRNVTIYDDISSYLVKNTLDFNRSCAKYKMDRTTFRSWNLVEKMWKRDRVTRTSFRLSVLKVSTRLTKCTRAN